MKKLMWRIPLLLLAGVATSIPVSAGNIFLTGHDYDFHCAFAAAQCNSIGIAVSFAASGAPDPTKPILVLDKGGLTGEVATSLNTALAKAHNTIQGAGNAFNFVVMDPTSAAFAAAVLTPSNFSAIVIASDSSCGGCDLTLADLTAINARTADITSFFNAGGGLVYLAGAEERATYYASVPIPAAAVAVASPFTLTAAGIGLGLNADNPNCCATHNSFTLPGAGSALVVAELDTRGNAETLFAGGATIGGGGFTPGGVIPEPASLVLFGSGLASLAGLRFRKSRKSDV